MVLVIRNYLSACFSECMRHFSRVRRRCETKNLQFNELSEMNELIKKQSRAKLME